MRRRGNKPPDRVVDARAAVVAAVMEMVAVHVIRVYRKHIIPTSRQVGLNMFVLTVFATFLEGKTVKQVLNF